MEAVRGWVWIFSEIAQLVRVPFKGILIKNWFCSKHQNSINNMVCKGGGGWSPKIITFSCIDGIFSVNCQNA